MAKYGSFKYDGAKYGVTASDLLLWTFIVDWDNDGYFSGENEAEQMIGLSTDRGRDHLVQASGDGLEAYQVGRATAILDNDDGRYDPFNTSSPLYPDVTPGKLAILAVKYGANHYGIISGKVADIQPFNDGNRRKCRIEIVDGREFFEGKTLKIGYRGDFAFAAGYSAIRSGDWMVLILDSTDWPWETYIDIWDTAIGDEIGYHLIRHGWFWLTPGMEGVKLVADSEAGVFLHDRNGIAQFPVGNYSDLLVLDESQVLRDISSPQPWEVVRNQVEVTANMVRKFSTPPPGVVVFEMGGDGDLAIPIDAGENIEFSARFKYDSIPLLTGNIYDYESTFTDADDGGAALDHTITLLSELADGAEYRISNDTGTDGYLRLFQVVILVGGQPEFQSVNTEEDDTSISNYGERILRLDNKLINNTDRAKIVGQQLLAALKTPAQFPTIKLEDRPEQQFRPDLFNTAVNFTSDTLSIDNTLRIGKISHQWLNENGQRVLTIFTLEPDLSGTLPSQIEFTYLNDFSDPAEVDGAGPPPSGKMEWALLSPNGWYHDTDNDEIYGQSYLGFARNAYTVGLSETVVAGMFIYCLYRYSSWAIGGYVTFGGTIYLTYSVSGFKTAGNLEIELQKLHTISDEHLAFVYEIPATYIGETLTKIEIWSQGWLPSGVYLRVAEFGLGVMS